jgi:hypothetical protein
MLGMAMLMLSVFPDKTAAQLVDESKLDQWRVSVTPVYWASILAGALTLEQPPDPLISGNYVFDVGDGKLGNGYGFEASAGRKRWDVQVTAYGATVADSSMLQFLDMPTDSIPGYYDFSWSEASIRGLLRVGPYLSPYVRIYAGIRWINWKTDLFGDADNQLGAWDETWIDPMIGANTRFGLGAGFSGHAHVDAAGFNLGGSELSWTVSGGLSYHVAGPVTLVGTYAYKQVSYDNGKTGDELQVWKDGVAQGWFFGLNVSFPARQRR